MRFANSYEIEEALRRFDGHPILGPASQTLSNLSVWADNNSDGWCYWPKPCRAAARLIELMFGDGTNFYREAVLGNITLAEYRSALRPIKAFRTRQGADFVIVESRA